MLELGCGPGALWQQNADRLPARTKIVLSDFSAGVVHEARANLGQRSHAAQFCQLDAGAVPFKSGASMR